MPRPKTVKTDFIFRSDAALGNDIIGQQERLGSQQKVFIPLSALSRIENVKIMKGHFTKLWKARWTSKDGKVDVAIKQLKHNDSHLLPFMQMCAHTMLWNDSTLIKIHGATLGKCSYTIYQGSYIIEVTPYL